MRREDVSSRLVSIHDRHADVHEDQLEVGLAASFRCVVLEHVHSKLSIFSSFNLYAICSLEKHSERHYIVEVVFNYEDRGDTRAVLTFLSQFAFDAR